MGSGPKKALVRGEWISELFGGAYALNAKELAGNAPFLDEPMKVWLGMIRNRPHVHCGTRRGWLEKGIGEHGGGNW